MNKVWHLDELDRRLSSIQSHVSMASAFAEEHGLEEIGGWIGNISCAIDEILWTIADLK